MTFGEKLQKLRAREGLSQDALAEMLDVSRQAVSRWERDETMPETEKIVRLSSYFHVTTDCLLKDEEPIPPQSSAPAATAGSRFQRGRRLIGGVFLAIGVWRVVLMVPSMAIVFQMLSNMRILEMAPGVGHGASGTSFPVLPISMLVSIIGAVGSLLLWLAVTAAGLWLLLGKGKRR